MLVDVPNVQNRNIVEQNENHDAVETEGSHITDHVNETTIQDTLQPQLHHLSHICLAVDQHGDSFYGGGDCHEI